MNFTDILQIATAVILGNAASFAFFMGAMQASKHGDDMPKWAYLCMIVPLLFGAAGAWTLH